MFDRLAPRLPLPVLRRGGVVPCCSSLLVPLVAAFFLPLWSPPFLFPLFFAALRGFLLPLLLPPLALVSLCLPLFGSCPFLFVGLLLVRVLSPCCLSPSLVLASWFSPVLRLLGCLPPWAFVSARFQNCLLSRCLWLLFSARLLFCFPRKRTLCVLFLKQRLWPLLRVGWRPTLGRLWPSLRRSLELASRRRLAYARQKQLRM